MTLGEMGEVVNQPGLDAKQVAQVRQTEFNQAMGSIGANHESMGFADLALSTLNFRIMAMPMLDLLRSKDFAALFTFHPYEITPDFDHPDHNITGQVARFAASAQDVRKLQTGPFISSPVSHQATENRPELYFWTTDKNVATHKIGLSKKVRQNRDNYLTDHYPSQFPRKSQSRWGKIFDRITYKGLLQGHQEYYQRVR